MGEIARRDFLRLAAGQAAAGFALSGKSADKLISYVVPPEHVLPGKFAFFATTCRECPAGCGMHLWHRDGRVTKAEGNPARPVNGGGLCARGQSSLLGLYDRTACAACCRPAGLGRQPWDWADAIAPIGKHIRTSGGHVVLVSDLQAGALADLMDAFSAAFELGPPLLYEPFDYEPQRAAHDALFGLPAVPDYRIDECEFVISFAADFLETWLSPVQFARRFAQMHAYHDKGLGRFAYVGPRLSVTAANADDFLQVPPGGERAVALAMLKVIVEKGWAKHDLGDLGRSAAALAGPVPGVEAARIEELAKAFVDAKGSVALPGPDAGAGPVARDTALAAALLNYAADRVARRRLRPRALHQQRLAPRRRAPGARGADVRRRPDRPQRQPRAHDAGRRHAAQGRPARLPGHMLDETAEQADLVLPIDSPLESWGDYEPEVGVHSLMQPTMARLYDTRMAGDVLMAIAQAAGGRCAPGRSEAGRRLPGLAPPALGRSARARVAPEAEPEQFWRDALRRGGVWEQVQDVVLPTALGQAAFGPGPGGGQIRRRRPTALAQHPALRRPHGQPPAGCRRCRSRSATQPGAAWSTSIRPWRSGWASPRRCAGPQERARYPRRRRRA